MICFLENYEPGRFAETFLGEFETPEAIWNSEMRRMMIEKIAAHIADFTPRLQTNTRATYQYLAIPLLQYPQLENELFCNIYYLKHLTDTQRYPDWPIKEPVSTADHSTGCGGGVVMCGCVRLQVKVLKDVLEAWKKEVEKKPPPMSLEEAYQALGLATGVGG